MTPIEDRPASMVWIHKRLERNAYQVASRLKVGKGKDQCVLPSYDGNFEEKARKQPKIIQYKAGLEGRGSNLPCARTGLRGACTGGTGFPRYEHFEITTQTMGALTTLDQSRTLISVLLLVY
ncbi:hypothetical protein SAY87_000692 [Trapa incisa]|uniref:Uncharacterized protein n=1 Tax=Trapa incisa TaxID=236973 RepID=A0AAN7GCG7_9MYRT|nr:hypothetical protein SAY87_000692 [Trapa incisa]